MGVAVMGRASPGHGRDHRSEKEIKTDRMNRTDRMGGAVGWIRSLVVRAPALRGGRACPAPTPGAP